LLVTEPATDRVNGYDGGLTATDTVIDLREPPTTVRVSRDDNPFASLSPPDRMRLIIRVLCELVAYGEVDDQPTILDGPEQPV
jgi:hypothetical protein